MYIQLDKSDLEQKKYKAVFYDDKRRKLLTVHFGARGYSDFTQHQDEERKMRYLDRHQAKENWEDPFSAGSLSRWLLWNKKSISASYNDYLKRFNLKKY